MIAQLSPTEIRPFKQFSGNVPREGRGNGGHDEASFEEKKIVENQIKIIYMDNLDVS